MKRLGKLGFALVVGSWMTIGVVAAQTLAQRNWAPESMLFNDALTFARLAPFIAAIGILVGIWQARNAARAGGDRIVGQSVVRHDRGTTVAHWVNATGSIVSLATGAIILGWVHWPAEIRVIFLLHFVGAALKLYAVPNHLTRHGVAGGFGLIPRSWAALRDTMTEMFEYAGVFGRGRAAFGIPWPKGFRQPIARYLRGLGLKKPEGGKYLAAEQTLSYPVWGILTVVVVITGLIKTLRYVYPMPSAFIGATTMVHDLAAIGIAVMLVIHLAPLLLVPGNWPLLKSMFTTRVPVQYVKEHHPAWYQQLLRKPVVSEPVAPAAPRTEALASLKGGD